MEELLEAQEALFSRSSRISRVAYMIPTMTFISEASKKNKKRYCKNTTQGSLPEASDASADIRDPNSIPSCPSTSASLTGICFIAPGNSASYCIARTDNR